MCPVQVKCPRDETHSHGDTGEGGAGGCPRVAGEGAGGGGARLRGFFLGRWQCPGGDCGAAHTPLRVRPIPGLRALTEVTRARELNLDKAVGEREQWPRVAVTVNGTGQS